MADFVAGPDLLARLALTQTGPLAFEGNCGIGPGPNVFGGHIAAQALLAAGRTVETDRLARSMHAYFLRAGDPAKPISYDVTVLTDGRSSSSRSVLAHQDGRGLFTLIGSFQVDEDSTETQVEAPDFGPPEDYAIGMNTPVEVRPIGWTAPHGNLEPRQALWIRSPVTLPDDRLVHAAAVAFAIDMTLGWSPWKALGIHQVVSEQMWGASLDHSLWFHRAVQADEWMLLHQNSQAVAGGRGLAVGHLFDTAGRLLVTAAQEGLMRGTHESVAVDLNGTVPPPRMSDADVFLLS